MATSMDFFRKLGTGAKFDLKRFKSDAERFQIIKPTTSIAQDDIAKTLDIFGTSSKSTAIVKRLPTEVKGRPKSQAIQAVHKRKRADNVEVEKTTAKAKKKRKESKSDSVVCKGDKDTSTTSLLEVQKQRRHISKGKDEDDFDSDDEVSSAEDDDEEKDIEQSDVTLMSSFKDKSKELSQDDDDAVLDNQDQTRQHTLKSLRKHHRIHVLGTDVPDPLSTFHEMQQEYHLHTDIVENIHKAGYVTPTPIQMQAIPVMIHRRELLACAPTGSGKTAAFILPVLHYLKEPRKQGFRAVVVSPSRELAQQTYREFVRMADGRGFRIHTIDNTANAAKKFGPQSAGKFDILVTTPNRLVYMLKQDPPTIKLNNVEWLIVDESDKLFEGGKTGFREQLATIYQACNSNHVRRAMFSATFTFEVEQWCKLNLDNVVMVTVGQRNAATDTVKQDLQFVGDEYGKLLAIRDIFKKGFLPPVLIFVQSKERAKELFHELIYDGYNVDVIHADKSQVQRDNVVRSFRAGKIWVLIATELMGRGIDFKGVNLVINYDFPRSAISYIHRIGRTGRAGREGSAITMFTEDDIVQLRSIANVMRNAGCPVPEYMLQLKKLSKKSKKKLEKRPMRRKTIRTLPTPELERAKRKKNIIKGKPHHGGKSFNKSTKKKTDESKQGKEGKPKNKHTQGKMEQQGSKGDRSQGERSQGDSLQNAAMSNSGGFKQRRTKVHKKLGKKNRDTNQGKNKTRTIHKKSGVKPSSVKAKKFKKKKAKL